MPSPKLTPNPVWSFRHDGSVMDLSRPRASEIDLRLVAGRLSRIARFNGVPEGMAYSVAQHSVLGARAIEAERKDSFLASLFLFHDAHEALLGDVPTPVTKLMDAMIPGFRAALDRVKAAWDEPIYDAFGLPAPARWNALQKNVVTSMDARMCAFEARALMGDRAASQFPRVSPPRVSDFRPWPAVKAEMEFIEMAERLIGEPQLAAARRSALEREDS